MTLLVTGASGQLGYDVSIDLRKNGISHLAPVRSELDIVNKSSVEHFFDKEDITSVLHCAAWTHVDLAEDCEEQCRLVNVHGTENLVQCCKKYDIPLLYVSTDYVFDGMGFRPRKIEDAAKPINVYGQSKLDGECIVRQLGKHYIVRTSWIFGNNGNNFIKTIIKLSNQKHEIKVVSDQFGSPTYTKDLAPLLRKILASEKYGTYHAHNEGYCSWYILARYVIQQFGNNSEIVPIKTKDYPTKAARPKNSRLDLASLDNNGFDRLPSWKSAVDRYLMELKSTE